MCRCVCRCVYVCVCVCVCVCVLMCLCCASSGADSEGHDSVMEKKTHTERRWVVIVTAMHELHFARFAFLLSQFREVAGAERTAA